MMMAVYRCCLAVIHLLLAVSSPSVGTVHKNYDTVVSCSDLERQMCALTSEVMRQTSVSESKRCTVDANGHFCRDAAAFSLISV